VAQWQTDHYEAYAVTRPADRTIALYPNCSRGKGAHVGHALKWWLLGTTGALFFVLAFLAFVHFIIAGDSMAGFIGPDWVFFLLTIAAVYLWMGLFAAYSAWRWMKFVRLAERTFKALGWPRPSMIDLVKSSKNCRQEGDPPGYGVFYFRY
jgi:hypothetical protein